MNYGIRSHRNNARWGRQRAAKLPPHAPCQSSSSLFDVLHCKKRDLLMNRSKNGRKGEHQHAVTSEVMNVFGRNLISRAKSKTASLTVVAFLMVIWVSPIVSLLLLTLTGASFLSTLAGTLAVCYAASAVLAKFSITTLWLLGLLPPFFLVNGFYRFVTRPRMFALIHPTVSEEEVQQLQISNMWAEIIAVCIVWLLV